MISTFTVLFDANVLYSKHIRSLLVELARSGLFRAKWSADIHREWIDALLKKRPDLERTRLERTRRLVDTSLPDALVVGYEDLISALSLPDPDDRHVLAAAIRCGASAIVTFNERHFPADQL